MIGKIRWKKHNMSYFCWLYALLPIVDTLNGFTIFMLHKNYGIGQIYRVVMMFLVFYMLFHYRVKVKYVFLLAVMLGVYAGLLFIHILIGGGGGIKDEFMLMFQWILFPILLCGFFLLSDKNKYTEKDLFFLLELYQWVLPITILLPRMLGTGVHTYGGEIGYKGFYYANNGVSYFASVMVIYSLYQVYLRVSGINVIKFILNAVICLLIGTKSCLFAIAFGLLMVFWEMLNARNMKKITKNIVVVLAILIIGILSGSFIMKQLDTMITRFNYFLTKQFQGNMIGALTTGRTGKVLLIWRRMKEEGAAAVWFGLGDIGIVAEMDFFDIFFQYGIIGLFTLAAMIYFIVRNVYTVQKIYKYLIAFSLAYSIVSGHVLNNSMSIMVFVLIISSGAVAGVLKQSDTLTNATFLRLKREY